MNNNIIGYDQNTGQPIYGQPVQKKGPNVALIVVIVLIVLVLFVAGIVVMFTLVFSSVSASSKKMVCKSPEGNITIMYNDNNITGYTAKNMSYDLSGQKKYAKEVGIDNYLDEFNEWFELNTSGSCTFED